MNAPRRTRKRRLRIAFIGRVPKDARRLLEETEEVFRAADTTVEFHLGSPPCGGDMRDITYRADEQNRELQRLKPLGTHLTLKNWPSVMERKCQRVSRTHANVFLVGYVKKYNWAGDSGAELSRLERRRGNSLNEQEIYSIGDVTLRNTE